jgi:hypothetical protein
VCWSGPWCKRCNVSGYSSASTSKRCKAQSSSRNQGRFLLSGQADPAARSIARKARKIPYFFIRWGALLSLGAYAFDLVVGLSLYPPAASLNTFLFALSSGLWSGIDMGNLAKLLVMLFAFEVVLILLIIALQWVNARQAAVNAQ